MDDENFEMRDRDRSPPEEDYGFDEDEEEETRFGEEEEFQTPPRENIGKFSGIVKRGVILDKKKFLQENFGIVVRKKDGPNSVKLFDSIEFSLNANNEVSGMEYKNKKIVVRKKGGGFMYTTDKFLQIELR